MRVRADTVCELESACIPIQIGRKPLALEILILLEPNPVFDVFPLLLLAGPSSSTLSQPASVGSSQRMESYNTSFVSCSKTCGDMPTVLSAPSAFLKCYGSR
jgi:hypothetical protein